jgi:hypothetical protein
VDSCGKTVFTVRVWPGTVADESPMALRTTHGGAVDAYRGWLWPFKTRRMATMVFQFRVVAGAL